VKEKVNGGGGGASFGAMANPGLAPLKKPFFSSQ
jgi:hypothetical protein